MGELPVEEQEEVRQELNEAAQEIQAMLDEVEGEMQAELNEASTELYAAWDEVSAEMYAALDEIRAEMEDADWVRGMICEDERPRKVLWRKGDMEAEIVDRVEFADSLALEDGERDGFGAVEKIHRAFGRLEKGIYRYWFDYGI